MVKHEITLWQATIERVQIHDSSMSTGTRAQHQIRQEEAEQGEGLKTREVGPGKRWS
jgi:hypothetical protein